MPLVFRQFIIFMKNVSGIYFTLFIAYIVKLTQANLTNRGASIKNYLKNISFI
jgi:hypothetical protein